MLRRRLEAIQVFGGCCKQCLGPPEEFHHVEPRRKVTHRVWSWAPARIAAELSKCALLCRLCHQSVTNALRRLRREQVAGWRRE